MGEEEEIKLERGQGLGDEDLPRPYSSPLLISVIFRFELVTREGRAVP